MHLTSLLPIIVDRASEDSLLFQIRDYLVSFPFVHPYLNTLFVVFIVYWFFKSFFSLFKK